MKTITVSCRLEERYLKQLREVTDRTDRTISWTLRQIVIDALDQRPRSLEEEGHNVTSPRVIA